ncbi:MAG: hypothetical protein FJ206_03590 [Gemmatimonadetes bacterium]|nr:hypothetical protein [Gemmatimonadota bacterium]
MLEYFRSSGYRYLDALSAFEPVESRHTVKDLTVQWGHFSALGNDLVARYLLASLTEWGLDAAPKGTS